MNKFFQTVGEGDVLQMQCVFTTENALFTGEHTLHLQNIPAVGIEPKGEGEGELEGEGEGS